MFRNFGPLEIGAILIIILIVFGVGKLPQVGTALGKGIASFRRAQQGEDEEKPATTPAAGKTASSENSPKA